MSNTSGAVHSEAGIDPEALVRHLADGGKLVEFVGAQGASDAEAVSPEGLMELDCEVLIPAALGGAIHADNADAIRARMIIEGANNPTTPRGDEILNDKDVLVIPDVLANAGGVVVSYFEAGTLGTSSPGSTRG